MRNFLGSWLIKSTACLAIALTTHAITNHLMGSARGSSPASRPSAAPQEAEAPIDVKAVRFQKWVDLATGLNPDKSDRTTYYHFEVEESAPAAPGRLEFRAAVRLWHGQLAPHIEEDKALVLCAEVFRPSDPDMQGSPIATRVSNPIRVPVGEPCAAVIPCSIELPKSADPYPLKVSLVSLAGTLQEDGATVHEVHSMSTYQYEVR